MPITNGTCPFCGKGFPAVYEIGKKGFQTCWHCHNFVYIEATIKVTKD